MPKSKGLRAEIAETCPRADEHTPHPTSYLAHSAWAEEMMKTHKQVKCPGCGLWKIWVPREKRDSD